jgi:beta-barrel assembly-enhancing protease
MQNTKCKFYDGTSSISFEVDVVLASDLLQIGENLHWKYCDIVILEKPLQERPAIITNRNSSDARLYIEQKEIFDLIKNKIPFIRITNQNLIKIFQELSAAAILVTAIITIFPYFVNFISERINKNDLDLLGNEIRKEITKSANLCLNIDGLIELNNITNKLSSGGQKKYNIYIVSNVDSNAFALPGNNIIIYSGLLTKLASANELAMVIAHEMGHIERQHHKNLYAMNLLLRNISGNNAAGLLTNIMTLKYSRDDEIEADLFAYDSALKNSIDPQYLISLLKVLENSNQKMEKLLSYISTHPATSERIKIIQNKIGNQKFESEEIITAKSWKNLKNICSKIKKNP